MCTCRPRKVRQARNVENLEVIKHSKCHHFHKLCLKPTLNFKYHLRQGFPNNGFTWGISKSMDTWLPPHTFWFHWYGAIASASGFLKATRWVSCAATFGSHELRKHWSLTGMIWFLSDVGIMPALLDHGGTLEKPKTLKKKNARAHPQRLWLNCSGEQPQHPLVL